MRTSPVGRWIVVSGMQPEAGAGKLGSQVAAELALRHSVLLWDALGDTLPLAKTPQELVPYRRVFSPELLRNFLGQPSHAESLLRGPLDGALEIQGEVISLLKNAFDYIFVLAPPSWKPDYLQFLDQAQAVVLVGTGSAQSLSEIRRHLEEFGRHKFPRALGKVVLSAAHHPTPEFLSACQRSVDHPILATIGVATGQENIRGLVHLLETRSEIYEWPRPLQAEAAQSIRNRIHDQLLEATAVAGLTGEAHTETVLENLISRESELPLSRELRNQVFKDLVNEVTGLGPLEPLLRDPDVAEIMVNGPLRVFVEKKGRLYSTDIRFDDEAQLRTVIDRIVAPIGRRVDESSPLCDGRLVDGSRVNIVLPPLALEGAILTIRKFMQKRLTLQDLTRLGTLNEEMAQFLTRCVQSRKNIIVSGGTGSGKTTLLNILSGLIASDERIVTIEDAAELKLQQPHVVRMESRPANAEGQGAIPIRRLVMNALRMRPDRIVVGECRGGEALDMLQAMNTGHDGSLTTLHANTPRDALGRLEALVLMSGLDLPVRVIREQIRSAVHIVVQIARLVDGSRKIVAISEITGMEDDVLTTAELYRFRAGSFEATGLVSTNMEARHSA